MLLLAAAQRLGIFAQPLGILLAVPWQKGQVRAPVEDTQLPGSAAERSCCGAGSDCAAAICLWVSSLNGIFLSRISLVAGLDLAKGTKLCLKSFAETYRQALEDLLLSLLILYIFSCILYVKPPPIPSLSSWETAFLS